MDQAEKLREIMSLKTHNLEKNPIKNKAKVLSISSGKGGVGKTNFAINFSISLQRLGYKVAVIDADIGLGNVEILLGLNIENTISDIIYSDKNIMDIMAEGPEGIKIISGGSGLKELALLKDQSLPKLIDEIESLQTIVDYIIIDTGAGISPLVLDFIMASNEVIIISTPDPTSIMDSYILIKSLITTGFNGKINIVANLVKDKKEGQEVYSKLNNASNSFLKVQTNYFGYIERNDIVNNAVKGQIPFTVSHPNSLTSKQLKTIVERCLGNSSILESKDTISFAKKLFRNIFKWGD